ncbi:MAG TPA: hypothetical protein VG537_10680 [Candidatus Kapabacteria bacterium]|jgi:hypothetical protein|nr:hypothetical protein [Candidatus Kapabacteria bacterium]
MARWLVPRLALSALMLSLAFFACFESFYLRDQAAEFGELKIVLWMWAFRGITALLTIGGIAIW